LSLRRRTKKFFTDVLKPFLDVSSNHLDTLEPTLYVESEVLKDAHRTDNMGDITPKIHNAYKKDSTDNVAHVPFACSSYRDALHVSFICVASTGKTITIYCNAQSHRRYRNVTNPSLTSWSC
jgi:hypothetical protein